MTWTRFDGDTYALRLGYGYFQDDALPDERIAERLYGLGKHLWMSERQRARFQSLGIIRNPVHVWIVDPSAAPLPTSGFLQGITEDTQHTRYRLVIAGSGIDRENREFGHLVGDWKTWSYEAGFLRTRPKDRTRFEDSTSLLLGQMHDRYIESRAAPSDVLDAFGFTYAYRGDPQPSKSDGEPERRIQQ